MLKGRKTYLYLKRRTEYLRRKEGILKKAGRNISKEGRNIKKGRKEYFKGRKAEGRNITRKTGKGGKGEGRQEGRSITYNLRIRRGRPHKT
jgi:hypothetical protein